MTLILSNGAVIVLEIAPATAPEKNMTDLLVWVLSYFSSLFIVTDSPISNITLSKVLKDDFIFS